MDIINLPNGSQWDNDLSFAANTPESQLWLFETLKLALELDPIVKNIKMGRNGKNLYYYMLKRESLLITCNEWYKFTGDIITEWTDLSKWSSHPEIVFKIKNLA